MPCKICSIISLTHFLPPDVDGEVDELGVLDDEVAQLVWFQELTGFLLQDERNGCASLEACAARVLHDREGRGVRLPDVLIVVIVFGGNDDRVSNCVCVCAVYE